MAHESWQDASGQSPGNPGPGWQWDAESLTAGEYVGYKLYLALRDRLTTLNIPSSVHNEVITRMVDVHDVDLLTQGRGVATLAVFGKVTDPSAVMEIWSGKEYGPRAWEKDEGEP